MTANSVECPKQLLAVIGLGRGGREVASRASESLEITAIQPLKTTEVQASDFAPRR